MEKNTSITNKKQQTNKLFKIFYINIILQENVFFFYHMKSG